MPFWSKNEIPVASESYQAQISLNASEAYVRDIGRGIARIDQDVLKKIGAINGSVVEVFGKKKTVAKCLPLYPSDRGLGIIRIDGIVRMNADVNVGDPVKIRRIDAKDAEKIALESLDPIPDIDERYLQDALYGFVFAKGDYVQVRYSKVKIMFRIVAISPFTDAVRVTKNTMFLNASEQPKMQEFGYLVEVTLYGKQVGVVGLQDGKAVIDCLLCYNRFKNEKKAGSHFAHQLFDQSVFLQHIKDAHKDFIDNREEKPPKESPLVLSRLELTRFLMS